MSGILILEQTLSGLQFGLMLFLLAAGLTLVFGIMDMINLAHGCRLAERLLRQPACPGVPKVVPAEVLDARPLDVLSNLPTQNSHRRFIPGHMDVPTAFCLVCVNPDRPAVKICLRPLQPHNIGLP